MKPHPHLYWTAGAFVVCCVGAGGLFGLLFAACSEWLHGFVCPCGAPLEVGDERRVARPERLAA